MNRLSHGLLLLGDVLMYNAFVLHQKVSSFTVIHTSLPADLPIHPFSLLILLVLYLPFLFVYVSFIRFYYYFFFYCFFYKYFFLPFPFSSAGLISFYPFTGTISVVSQLTEALLLLIKSFQCSGRKPFRPLYYMLIYLKRNTSRVANRLHLDPRFF